MLSIQLHTQPIRTSQAFRARTVHTDEQGVYDPDFADAGSLDMERRFFDFENDTPDLIENELQYGTYRYSNNGPPRRNLVIDLDVIPGDKLDQLDAFLRIGRPISVGAWYDDSTVWMSHFAGIDQHFGGVAEVGESAQGLIFSRQPPLGTGFDLHPHWLSGDDAHVPPQTNRRGNDMPKFVAGNVGRAILLQSRGFNLWPQRVPEETVSCWPNVSSAADVKVAHYQAQCGNPLGFPYVTHIAMSAIAGGGGITSIWASSEEVVTPSLTGLGFGANWCHGILARGSGSFRLGIRTSPGDLAVVTSSTFTLTNRWKWYWVTGAPGDGVGMKMFIYPGAGAGSTSLMMQFAGRQTNPGYNFTPFMDYTQSDTADHGDYVEIPKSIDWAGFTVAAWIKFANTDEEKPLLAIANTTGPLGGRFALVVRGYDIDLEIDNGSHVLVEDAFDAADEGSWCQVVMTFSHSEAGVGWNKYQIFKDGVLMEDYTSTDRQDPIISDTSKLWIGRWDGQDHSSLNMPLDCFRIDSHVWTATEVANDYEMRSDVGMRNFLRRVQGRYYRPVLSHRPFTSLITVQTGKLVLREVDRNEASAW